MSKTTYNIQLKGYVGGADFDRKAVDTTLANQCVNVLIDSFGGSLVTGLSISAAFNNLTDYSLTGKCPEGCKSFFVFVRFEDKSECLLSNIFTAKRADALLFVLVNFSDFVSYITNISLHETDC